MKKIIFILAMFQVISCTAQTDLKTEITGNWEQEYYNDEGEAYYIGEIYTFHNDNTCTVVYSSDTKTKPALYHYEIVKDDCSNTPSQEYFYLKMEGISGDTFDNFCAKIDIFNENDDPNSSKKIMTLYHYGALSSNVFIKRP